MYKEIVKPTLVLIVIVAVMSGLLAFTYQAAGIKELGKGVSQTELDAAIPQILPKATKLVSTNITSEDINFMGVYKDEGGNGVAMHVQSKGYGKDPLKMLVGINPDGTVAGVKIISTSESPGIGTKVEPADYLSKYIGKSGEQKVRKDGGDIDEIAGATISSRAVAKGVTTALTVYKEIKGGL